MTAMRSTWSNRLDIVDAFLRRKKLKQARSFALETLKCPEHTDMLSKDEIEYLKLVVALEKVADIMTMEDFSDERD